MFKLKNVVAAAAAVSAIVAGAPASAVIVGGIDFGVLPFGEHLETTTIAASFATSVGDVSRAYGQISTVNGDSTYCADGSSNCTLYFIVNNTVKAVVGNQLYFGDTKITVYYSGAAAANLLTQDSNANLAFISGLTAWASMSGEKGVDATAAGLLNDTRVEQNFTGAGSITVSGSGLLSIDTADGIGNASVEAFLNGNLLPTFNGTFADIIYTESANSATLNPFDRNGPLADSCLTAAPQVGDWCLAGTANLRGNVVPVSTPGTLALLGLGLVGVGVSRRFGKKS